VRTAFGATGALGVARLINVFLLMSSYAAILLITDRLFRDERVTFVTILLLLACVQPVFSCTFVYGLVPAFALCSWTGYFVVRYLQTGKMRNMIPAVVFMAAAAYVRSNSWIVIIALSIVLLVHAIRRRRLAPVLLAAALVLAALPFPKLAQTAYEAKIGTSFGSGYPKSYWMAMSLQDGWKSTGWHVQAYQEEMESTYGEDVDAIDARAEADIRAGVAELAADPKAAGEYLLEKLTSMWDEPTFTCIWITKSVKSYAEPGALAQWVYGDGFDAAFRFAMKKAVMVLYAGFALCAFALLRRRADEQLLLPLIILGGVLFHLLFEAKSQYVLEYLPFFCPLAAYGILSFGRGAEERLCEAIRKRRSEKRVRIEQKTN